MYLKDDQFQKLKKVKTNLTRQEEYRRKLKYAYNRHRLIELTNKEVEIQKAFNSKDYNFALNYSEKINWKDTYSRLLGMVKRGLLRV